MSLADSINRFKSGGFDNESEKPWEKLKHDQLRLTKEHNEVIVRILPATPKNGTQDDFFQESRQVYLQLPNGARPDWKLRATNFSLSTPADENDPLEQAVKTWLAKGTMPNKYGKGANSRYLMNAVQLKFDEGIGNYVPVVDDQGQLYVQVFQATYGLYNSLMEALSDKAQNPINTPAGRAKLQADQAKGIDTTHYGDWSFISSGLAYPVKFTRDDNGSGPVKYAATVMSAYPLGALPQGWEDQAEDLAYQAQSTYKSNPGFVQQFIDAINEVQEPEDDIQIQDTAMPGAMGGYTPQPVAQGYTPQAVQPGQQGYTGQVNQPAQGQQNPVGPQGTPAQPQGNYSGGAPVGQPAPQQQTPQAPQPTQPAPQQQMPQAPVQPTPQPTQQAPQAPQEPAKQAPQAPAGQPEDMEQVGDILNNIGIPLD